VQLDEEKSKHVGLVWRKKMVLAQPNGTVCDAW
jgi:hypothetical protein